MSNWTHVAAIARIDHLRLIGDIDFEKVFGRMLDPNNPDDWEEYHASPGRFLPCGSEGSLYMTVWADENTSSLAAYTVSIFGDLRDHDSPDEIVEWFKDKLEPLCVRNACITVYNEWYGTRFWHDDGYKD